MLRRIPSPAHAYGRGIALPPAPSGRVPVGQRGEEEKGGGIQRNRLPQIQDIEVRPITQNMGGQFRFTFQDLVILAFRTEAAAKEFFLAANRYPSLTERVFLRQNLQQVELSTSSLSSDLNPLFDVLKDFYRTDGQPNEASRINTLLGKYSRG